MIYETFNNQCEDKFSGSTVKPIESFRWVLIECIAVSASASVKQRLMPKTRGQDPGCRSVPARWARHNGFIQRKDEASELCEGGGSTSNHAELAYTIVFRNICEVSLRQFNDTDSLILTQCTFPPSFSLIPISVQF